MGGLKDRNMDEEEHYVLDLEKWELNAATPWEKLAVFPKKNHFQVSSIIGEII